MGTTVKSFFQSFSEIPEGKFPPEYYTSRLLRTLVFGNYAHSLGILTHSLFIVIFALIGVRILALFNIFSVILWATGFIIHRRGYISQGYILITIENIQKTVAEYYKIRISDLHSNSRSRSITRPRQVAMAPGGPPFTRPRVTWALNGLSSKLKPALSNRLYNAEWRSESTSTP